MKHTDTYTYHVHILLEAVLYITVEMDDVCFHVHTVCFGVKQPAKTYFHTCPCCVYVYAAGGVHMRVYEPSLSPPQQTSTRIEESMKTHFD